MGCCSKLVKQYISLDLAADSDKAQTAEMLLSQHVLVCALHELGCLVSSLDTSASPLVSEPASGILCSFFLFVFGYLKTCAKHSNIFFFTSNIINLITVSLIVDDLLL